MIIILKILGLLGACLTVILPILYNLADTSPSARSRQVRLRATFLLAAALALLAGFLELRDKVIEGKETVARFNQVISRIEREAMRLQPSDFQISLILYAPLYAKSKAKSFTVYGSIGDAYFEAVLELVDVGPSLEPRRKDVLFYRSTAFRIAGLEKYPYIESLSKVKFEFNLPMRKLKFDPGRELNWASLFVKGREYKGSVRADSNGHVVIALDKPVTHEPE